MSFLTILVMWVNHHSMFQFVGRLDRTFVFANGLLLMLVTFVNYPTALVANFAGTSPDNKFAAAVYSAVLIVISVVYRVMWFHAVNNGRLLATDVDPDEVAMISRQYRFGWLFYTFAFALAFVNAWASIALNAGLAIYFAFTGRILRSEQKPFAHQYDRTGEQEE